MTSRVQKGATVFKPIAKARSRAPTAPPGQSSSTPSDLSVVPEATPGPTLPPSLPIPSTAVPGREPLKQIPHPQPAPIQTPRQLPQNTLQGTPLLPPGTSTSPTVIRPHSPPVLVNASNLPPNLVSFGRPTAEPVNAVAMPGGPPMIIPLPCQMPASRLHLTQSDPSQQSTVIFTPSGQIPTEVTNTLVHSPSFENSQYVPVSGPMSHNQPQAATGDKPRRKQRLSDNNSDGETEDGLSSKRPKSRSTTPRQRRSRGPSLPPYDPSADPGEDIDPTVITMATLCSDTGQGRVSSKAAEILSNHAAWKARNRERRARMRAMMEAKKYGRTVDGELEQMDRQSNPLAEGEDRSVNGTGPSAGARTSGADEETGIDYSQQMETSRFNVQVRIGPNGETIIDEESLVVDRAENEDISDYTHVVESDHTKFVNSGTYGKRYRGSRWSAEETELFYNALSQYGENYELIAYVLPGRDRKSCKNKFKAEDKKNHARINYCLNNRIPVDMKTLERMTGKDFSGPVPEIRAPPPPPTTQLESRQEQENTEDTNTASTRIATNTKTTKKRSRSRTAGLEDGVVIIGDVDSIPP